MTSILNVKEHRLWVLLPLAGLLWHSFYTLTHFDPQYLLFVCYPSNTLLVLGLVLSRPVWIGIGAFWAICALPPYLYYAIGFQDYSISGLVFHLTGAGIGLLALASYRLPRFTWAWACLFGAALQLLARLLTEPAYNINAAFSVYQGYGIFRNYVVYLGLTYLGFAASFGLLQCGNAIYLRRNR